MGMIFYPAGFELYVDNSGHGELFVVAATEPWNGDPLVHQEWQLDLYGPQLGEFLARVTNLTLNTNQPGQAGSAAGIHHQRLGMVKMGRVALDGTKLQANASRHKAMSHRRLVAKEEQIEAEVAELEQVIAALLPARRAAAVRSAWSEFG
jgi:hypothetical protein